MDCRRIITSIILLIEIAIICSSSCSARPSAGWQGQYYHTDDAVDDIIASYTGAISPYNSDYVSGACEPVADNPASCCLKNYGTSCSTSACSPDPSQAILTLNNFEDGGDGGGASECGGQYYQNSDMVVALSTGWFDSGSRCGKQIVIYGNGAHAHATVVDECDSLHGCDPAHNGQPPCGNNIVDASPAVWQALGVSNTDNQLYGSMHITWEDANT